MQLQFRHQQFQADAASAVRDVFLGQPYLTPTYLLDQGLNVAGALPGQDTGWNNQPLLPQLTDSALIENLRQVQRRNGIAPSQGLEKSASCRLNLTVEMETGTGKTYTYIKTMFELNKAYGWSKFIVVVPSVAIREGVFKTFQITREHFGEEYNKKIRFFIYNSANLTEISRFAQDAAINVMIINNQAFNARGKDARRIDMRLDDFGSRKPIDMLAKTNPILIIDEPQSVEGKVTREKLQKFNPLLTLRYSATHRKDSIYNLVYKLDAQDAYNQNLVKKIKVTGFRLSGANAANAYLYLQSINPSSTSDPTATIEFEQKGKNGVRFTKRILKKGDNLYELSGELEEYRDRYTIKDINLATGTVEFLNGQKLAAGEVVGHVDEEQLRRLQIRETIKEHLERESVNFSRGIKTLSLFFIDEVAKYRKDGGAANGIYAAMFEEEYENTVADLLARLPLQPEYLAWLNSRDASSSHAGYFSIDKKGGKARLVNSEVRRGQDGSDDVDAYNLIMRDRERLLDLDEPVRFIFSHSALREGWDNPNVFQICTLKQSASDVRKRQEVGRGLRLCVNSQGERMDATRLGRQSREINCLTVIASDSYDEFSRGLQQEMAEALSDRPRFVDAALFAGRSVQDEAGRTITIDPGLASLVIESLAINGYVERGELTEKYYQDRDNGALKLQADIAPYEEQVIKILDSVLDQKAITPEDGRQLNVTLQIADERRNSEAFKKLWQQINAKSAYTVRFDEDELIARAIAALNVKLHVQQIYFTVESGVLDNIESRGQLESGRAFRAAGAKTHSLHASAASSVKYDLLGKLVGETGLTRSTLAAILTGIQPDVFAQFRANPEDFIIRAARLINEEKATLVIEHITYDKLEARYDMDIFTDPGLKGRPGENAMPTRKHLYDYLVYDSENERKFAEKLEQAGNEVEVYVKLPGSFYISTPVGKYNPDWAIAFHEGDVKHVYFVAETKGSLSSLELRKIEASKIQCARKHFEAISSGKIKYDVISNYGELLNLVK